MRSCSLSHLADEVLLRDLALLVHRHHTTTAALLAHLAEVEARKLYAPVGFTSMHDYCVAELKLSPDVTAKRLQAARAAREFPAVFAAVADGRLHVSAVVLLAPHLAEENVAELVAAAAHQSKREIRQRLATRLPTRVAPLLVPASERDGSAAPADVMESTDSHAPDPAAPSDAQKAPLCVGPLSVPAPQPVPLRVALAAGTYDKLRYAQALLSHAVPSGDVAEVLDRALDALVAQLEKRKFGVASRSRLARRGGPTGERGIPVAVRLAVVQRDGGRCTFEGSAGHRCESRKFLEFDHVTPVAKGGESTVANVRLLCRTHNQLEARRAFGAGFIERKREEARRRGEQKREAARAKEAERARRGANARELEANAEARARAMEVVPWLRALGVRADEARRAAATCEGLADAPLEERVRHALRGLAPASARRIGPVASAPA